MQTADFSGNQAAMLHTTVAPSRPGASLALVAPTGISWLLWSVAAALPWLLPIVVAPWTTAYQELMMAGVMVPVAAWVLIRQRGRFQLDPLVVGILMAALVPPLQALCGIFSIPAESVLVSLYLVGIAFVLVVARHAELIAPGCLINALFAALFIAALGSTGVALCQWLGVDAYESWVLSNPLGDRPIGNIAQPNNLATLLVWGLLAIWWAVLRRRIGGWVATFAAGFILIGIALTQSRTGFLEVVTLGVAAFFWRRLLGTSGQAKAWIGLFVWLVLLTLALQPLSQWLIDAPTRVLLDAASPRERTTVLSLDLVAIRTYPWFGVGWNQNVVAHVALADQFPMHGTVGNAHNLFLDLLIWNGIPLGLAMIAGLCMWFWRELRKTNSWEDALPMLGVSVLGLHTMLELPHLFTYFLFPFAVMAGTLSARHRARAVVTLARPVAAALAALLCAIVVSITFEYGEVASASIDARMREARIAGAPPEKDLNVFVLRALRDSTAALRIEPKPGMDQAKLDRLRVAVGRYPTPSGLFRYAEAAAMNGQPEEAARSLRVICDLKSATICREARKGWKKTMEEGHPELAMVRLPDEPVEK